MKARLGIWVALAALLLAFFALPAYPAGASHGGGNTPTPTRPPASTPTPTPPPGGPPAPTVLGPANGAQLIEPLTCGERAVENRHPLPQPPPHRRRDLRRERDLGNQ